MVVRIGTGRDLATGNAQKTPNRRSAVASGKGSNIFCHGRVISYDLGVGTISDSLSLSDTTSKRPHKLIRRLGPRREPVPPRLRVPDEDDVDVAARARVAPDARLDGTTHGLDHNFRRRLRLSQELSLIHI